MAASRENGVDERLNVGGSIRVAPVRRLLRMPIRLLPRVGERPAGADMGVVEPRERLLSFLAGDFGFRMDRERGDAPLRGLAKTEAEIPSLPLGNAEVEEDLVRMNVGGLMKSLLEPSDALPLDLLENRSAGSTFSKSSTFRKSATLRFPGDDSAMAADSLAPVQCPVQSRQHGRTRPTPIAELIQEHKPQQHCVVKGADLHWATTYKLAGFSRWSSSAVVSRRGARTADV